VKILDGAVDGDRVNRLVAFAEAFGCLARLGSAGIQVGRERREGCPLMEGGPLELATNANEPPNIDSPCEVVPAVRLAHARRRGL